MSTTTGHAQQVREFIADGIRAGVYGARSKLPTERALSVQLAVPRSAVRDALAVLESGGAVTRTIGSGTFELYAMITPARDVTAWGELKRRSLCAQRRDHDRRAHRVIVAALKAWDAAAAEMAPLGHLERVRSN